MGTKSIKKKESTQILIDDYSVQPLGDLILVEVDRVEKTSKTGLKLFDSNDDYQNEQKFYERGVVVAVGPYAYEKAYFPEGPWVKIGDHITYRRYAGDLQRDHKTDKVYRLLHEKDPNLILTPIEV